MVGGRRVPVSTWSDVARSAGAGFQRHQVTDIAAGLTYYAVLALFPGLVAVVSLLGVVGDPSTTQSILDLLGDLGQADVAEQLEDPIRQMVESRAAGLTLVLGLVGALWSASGYVGAFGRAMNRVYGVTETRPFWKLRPAQLGITTVLVVLTAAVSFGLVVSGSFARELGDRIGVGETAVRVWNYGKLPVLLLIVVVIVALLYWATPNVRRRIRFFSAGAGLAILIWVLASIGFGAYVANFGSYNATYGSLAGVIVFLLWLWLTNVALLFGAEVDAELERVRELRAGLRAEEALQLPTRDDTDGAKQTAKASALVARRREIRDEAMAAQARVHVEPAAGDRAPSRPVAPPAGTSTPSTPVVLAQAAGVGLLGAVIAVLAGLLGVGDRNS